MKFSLNKLKAAFGSPKAMEHTHSDDYIEAIINHIDEIPFAISESNIMYSALGELGGYHFMQTIIVGNFRIKTIKGAKLKCNGDDFELNLDSDMGELESEPSNIPGRSVTRIDFQIEENDVLKIDKSKIKAITLINKKDIIEFNIYEEESTN